MLSIQTIFIIHHDKHKEREPFMQHTIDALNVLFTSCKSIPIWLASGSELSEEQLSFFAKKPISPMHFRNACSLTYHHMHCLQLFLESNEKYAILLEDDVFVNSPSLLEKAFQHISNLPSFDSVYLGDGCQPDIYDGKPPGCIPTPWSRCTEAICYSRKGAEKVLAFFQDEQQKKCVEPQLDFFFNKAYKAIKHYENFHAHPAPISQATCKNFLPSTINTF